MRRKFFLISFSVLSLTTLSISAILLFYFQNERMNFLDAQIRQAATAVLDSKIYNLKPSNFKYADEIISEELGPDSVGKFFIIRDDRNEIMYQSQNIQTLPDTIPQKPQWVTLTTNDYLIRAVNLELPRISGRTMQVGIIVDASFLSIANVNDRAIVLILAVFVMILLFTWFLSSYLFSPIGLLATYVNDITRSFERDSELPPLPTKFQASSARDPFAKLDEFQSLLRVLKSMVDKINTNRRFMRSWTFQMAHELKTPLTLLNRDFEIITQKHSIAEASSKAIESTIRRISDTISGFLGWAEMTSLKKVENLYVVRLSEVFEPLQENWEKVYPGRILVQQEQDFQILCNPLHLEQLIDNLLGNALKYSAGMVTVAYGSYQLTVTDQGSGIPEEVLLRIGSPFNKGLDVDSKKGVGLGLAWVKTICELYSWDLSFKSSPGATVQVKFKPLVME